MAIYRVLGLIPTVATLPGGGGPTTAPDAEITKAVNLMGEFPKDMLSYSSGMCTIELAMRVISDPLPSSIYTTVNSAEIILPTVLGTYIGETDNYDCVILMNPSNLTTATTFRGIGGTSSGTPYAWCKIESEEQVIMVHEFGHAMTAYLGTVMGTYTNFPSCGVGEPAIHCAEEYGYISDIDPLWLHDFMSGTIVPDNTGINATGWAVNTPTEEDLKTLPRYDEMNTPWGQLGPLLISGD